MANTTWSTTDKLNITLSGSNLIATGSGVGGVRAADFQASGLLYWETTCTTWGNASGVGIAKAVSLLGANSGIVCAKVSGNILLDGVATASTLGARANGDIIGHALNATTGQYWARVCPSGNWNGNAAANPATGFGGVSLATWGIPGAWGVFPFLSSNNLDVVTANFGDSAFNGTVPSGFTSGFTSGATLPTSLVASQLGAETFFVGNGGALRISQLGIETFYSLIPALVITQTGVEVFIDHSAGYGGSTQAFAVVFA